MIRLFSYIYKIFNVDYEKEYSKKLENELEFFENGLDDETVKEIPQVSKEIYDTNKYGCVRRRGIITNISDKYGIINGKIKFYEEDSDHFKSLSIGCTVEYVIYGKDDIDDPKVVSVLRIEESSWDDVNGDVLDGMVELLKNEHTKFFTVHERSILGMIASRNEKFLIVETDYKEMKIDLDAVKIEFIPQQGDRVYLECKVQTDESFIDSKGEILEVISINPARRKSCKNVITAIHDEGGVIGDDCYYTTDTVDCKSELKKGDNVSADMIECEFGPFTWRCVSLALWKDTDKTPGKETENTTTHQAIHITDDITFTLANTDETDEKEILITNKCDATKKLFRIDIKSFGQKSQLKLNNSPAPVKLEPGKTVVLKLECTSRVLGCTSERMIFNFFNFKISRNVEIAVGLGPEQTFNGNRPGKYIPRPLQHAQQVFSRQNDMIPGVRPHQMPRFVANKIDKYDIPEILRNILLSNITRSEQIEKLSAKYQSLQHDLSLLNYARRFQTLLYIEEVEQFVNFRQYDRERAHFTREGEYLALAIDNLAERRPSLVLGDSVRITNPWSEELKTSSYQGCIHKVLFNRVLLKFNPHFHNSYNGEDYRIEFFFSRYSFRKQHHAVRTVAKTFGEHFLFPTKINLRSQLQLNVSTNEDNSLLLDDVLCEHQWFNTGLNRIQKQAIVGILRGEAKTMPYIIFGPPGTGKTITVVEAILQITTRLSNSRILVATPSNSAADLITTRLILSKALKPGDFVRLVSQNVLEQDIIPDVLKPYCVTVDLSIEGCGKNSMTTTKSGVRLNCQSKFLGRHKITISTCGSLGNLLQLNFPKDHFTHLFIDECGQCSEPEVMVPVCLLSPDKGQIILAGDPCQLGPIIVNSYAGETGLRVSYLDRIMETFPYKKDRTRFAFKGYDPRIIMKLIHNYRALPAIMDKYNRLFYEMDLKATRKDIKEFEILKKVEPILPFSGELTPNHAVCFHGIRGQNKQDTDSPSWYNPIEAKYIFLMTLKLYRLEISPEQIGIITPYQKQVKLLRNLFAEAKMIVPKVGSVEEFQGQERDIILVSTVRSSESLINFDVRYALGFMSSPKRMNVAISRARSLLYVCGNPHLLSLSNEWRQFIQICVDTDCYTGCDLPECIKVEHVDVDENLPPVTDNCSK